MLKWTLRILAALAVLLLVAFLIFRTPDTDPVEMRAKYAGEPSQFIELPNGQMVHVRDEGPRDAPAIVLLHGSNSDLHTWEPWVQRLRNDYRVIRFDQIGHGLTGPAVDDTYDMASFVAGVDAVADELGLDQFVLGGNSMGGGISMGYALAHPERLSGLVLVDASGAPVQREKGESGGNIGFTIARMPVIKNLVTQITPRSLIQSSLEQSVSNQDVVTEQAVDRYWEMLRYPGNRQATLDRFGAERVPFDAADVAVLEVPTLIIWGEEDALIPFSAAAWFADNLPNAISVSYADIGHLPMEETPDRSAADLREWLANLKLTTDVS